MTRRIRSTLVRLRPLKPFYSAIMMWNSAGGLRMSAAMSFYGVLSLAPLLVLLVAVLGWWVDKDQLEMGLLTQVTALVGEQAASVIRQALSSAQQPSQGIVATLISFVILISGATGVFGELQSTLEGLWRQGRPDLAPTQWWHTMTLRLRGIGYIMVFGFLLLVSMAISAALSFFSSWAGDYVAMEWVLKLINEGITYALCVGLFMGMMRMSSGPKPGTRFMVIGAVIGATLFTVGRYALSMYLSKAAAVSAYGAAGSIVVVLMWIYFSSAILLLSACFARSFEDLSAHRKRRKQVQAQSRQDHAAIQGAAQSASRAVPASLPDPQI